MDAFTTTPQRQSEISSGFQLYSEDISLTLLYIFLLPCFKYFIDFLF